jgi:serine/threonine-protein kinase
VIHRDIKPDNILFAADGTPKLADLGVAKFVDDATVTMVTRAGMIVGTPAYMAPEQMMDSHSIDARADIYSLGVVLYEMLTNKRPNDGSTVMGMLAKAIRGEPLPDVRTMRPEVSAAVAYVLSLMCAPKPEDRPKTSGAAADLLVRADTDSLLMVEEEMRSGGPGADVQKRRWWHRFGLSGKAST